MKKQFKFILGCIFSLFLYLGNGALLPSCTETTPVVTGMDSTKVDSVKVDTLKVDTTKVKLDTVKGIKK